MRDRASFVVENDPKLASVLSIKLKKIVVREIRITGGIELICQRINDDSNKPNGHFYAITGFEDQL